MRKVNDKLNKNAEEKKIKMEWKDKLTVQSSGPPILFALCLIGHERRVFLWMIAGVVPNEHASKQL